MNFQKGIVSYKDRTDIECTFVTIDNVVYYLLELGYSHTLSNGNMIASPELVEAIDPMYHSSHIGVFDAEGKTVIPFTNRAIRAVKDDILLVEAATPVSESVINANQMKNDPVLATKLVSVPASIKARLNGMMNGVGNYIFNNQFSEATIYDINGKNLIDNEYYSFIAEADNKLFFSKNTVDGDIREYSLLPEEVQNNVAVDSSANKIDVSQVEVPVGLVDDAMKSKDALEKIEDTIEEVVPELPTEEKVEETTSVEAAVPELPTEEKVEETTSVETAVPELPTEEKVEETTSVEEVVPELPTEEKVEETAPVEAAVPEVSEEKVEETTPVEEEEEEKEVALSIGEDDIDDETIVDFKPIKLEEEETVEESKDSIGEEVDDIDLDSELETTSLDTMIHLPEEKVEDEDPLKGFEIKTDSIDMAEENEDVDDITASVDAAISNVDQYSNPDSIVRDVSDYMSALLDKYKGSMDKNSKLQQQNDKLKDNNDKLQADNDKLKVSSEKLKSNLDKVLASRNILADKSAMQDKKIEALTAKIESLTAKNDSLTTKMKDLQATVSKQGKIITTQVQQNLDLEKVLASVRESLDDTYSYDEKEVYAVK